MRPGRVRYIMFCYMIAKPLFLPLQIFAHEKNVINFSKTRARIVGPFRSEVGRKSTGACRKSVSHEFDKQTCVKSFSPQKCVKFAKPLFLPLQIFAHEKNAINFSKTRTRIVDPFRSDGARKPTGACRKSVVARV